MKVTDSVVAAFEILRAAAETDAELNLIEGVEKYLTLSPENKNFQDLTGHKFGKLTVLGFLGRRGNNYYWQCVCECGVECVVAGGNLTSLNTLSCGCWRRAKHKTHGQEGTAAYNIWLGIKQRCFNPHNPAYKNYGGRGITMYPAWVSDFQAFYGYVSKLEHFGEEGYTLDRIDNNGNYEPENVRWADRKTQGRNKRNNRIVEYQGQKMTLAEAAEKTGLSLDVLYCRIYRGDIGERLFRPVK